MFEQRNLLAKMTMKVYNVHMASHVQPWLLSVYAAKFIMDQKAREPLLTCAHVVVEMDPAVTLMNPMTSKTLIHRVTPKLLKTQTHLMCANLSCVDVPPASLL